MVQRAGEFIIYAIVATAPQHSALVGSTPSLAGGACWVPLLCGVTPFLPPIALALPFGVCIFYKFFAPASCFGFTLRYSRGPDEKSEAECLRWRDGPGEHGINRRRGEFIWMTAYKVRNCPRLLSTFIPFFFLFSLCGVFVGDITCIQ